MRSLLLQLVGAVALVAAATAQLATPGIAPPTGFVNDRAAVLDPATRTKLTQLLDELKQKTGAEIAVLTVDTTAPLDDFTYGMQVADAWKMGKNGEDTGALVLVAVRDRKLRVLVGYGLEGILPDGLIGAIEDREMLPAFRGGDYSTGILRGVAEMARRIADSRGVVLSGAPEPGPRPVRSAAQPIPLWALLLIAVVLMMLISRGGGRRRWGRGPMIFPGGFGGSSGGGFGGFGGGGGGFGGFGGGGFGGGGAGRSW